jgi:hypothetical protein
MIIALRNTNLVTPSQSAASVPLNATAAPHTHRRNATIWPGLILNAGIAASGFVLPEIPGLGLSQSDDSFDYHRHGLPRSHRHAGARKGRCGVLIAEFYAWRSSCLGCSSLPRSAQRELSSSAWPS